MFKTIFFIGEKMEPITTATCLLCGYRMHVNQLNDGICELCKQRLKANPSLELCIDCKQDPKQKAMYPLVYPIFCWKCFVAKQQESEIHNKATFPARCGKCAAFIAMVGKTKDIPLYHPKCIDQNHF